ncbi:MAG: sugar phosphate isomerase/epimerase [Chitinophagaceae bacterium]|nr:sugar phosphate isomerase/epimerase [Chitinophagaceae bacterium]
MSGAPITDLSKLCIHTITMKPWTIEQSARKFAEAGVGGITVWRDAIAGRDIRATGKLLRSLNLEIVSLCRGGFFPALQPGQREAAIKENMKAIDEASELEAPMLVLVCGAAPGQSLIESREQIKWGIEACIPYAEKKGVQLTIEPLHPMYAGDRSAINTLEQANDIAEYFSSDAVGIAVDVYHLWWDPNLQEQVARCGKNGNLSAFHICDWKTPTLDMLNDRGIMGEGCINVREIRSWVEEAGFTGYNEVEIFSTIYWGQDQDTYFDKIIQGYLHSS